MNWAPYRVGHWNWISPWGWTWVDDAPWGFAPFHYGRWARIGPRWAWVPGRLAPRPVYAPALVAFVGGSGGGVSWSLSIGSGGPPQPSLGWFPLAPGEAFRPAYRVSPRYVTEVNHNIVVNNTVNVTNIYRYQREPAAVTAVTRDDFARGQPVRGNQRPLSATELSRAQVVVEHSAIPQRPGRADVRERPGSVPTAALPPAAVITRPVVGSRDDRRDEPRAGRPDSSDRNARDQPSLPAAPVAPGATGAQLPAAKPGLATPPALHAVPAPAPDRGAIDAEQRARQQQQLQRDQARQQGDPTQQQLQRDQQRRQHEESQRQRALHEQSQKRQALDQAAQAQQQQQQQQRAQQDQRHQAREQQQRQQLEQSKKQEQQNKRRADTANAPPPRPEGAASAPVSRPKGQANRNREP